MNLPVTRAMLAAQNEKLARYTGDFMTVNVLRAFTGHVKIRKLY